MRPANPALPYLQQHHPASTVLHLPLLRLCTQSPQPVGQALQPLRQLLRGGAQKQSLRENRTMALSPHTLPVDLQAACWRQAGLRATLQPVAALTGTAPAVLRLVPVMCRCRSGTTCTHVALLLQTRCPARSMRAASSCMITFSRPPVAYHFAGALACCASCTGSWPTWPWAGQHRRDPAVLADAVVFGAPAH